MVLIKKSAQENDYCIKLVIVAVAGFAVARIFLGGIYTIDPIRNDAGIVGSIMVIIYLLFHCMLLDQHKKNTSFVFHIVAMFAVHYFIANYVADFMGRGAYIGKFYAALGVITTAWAVILARTLEGMEVLTFISKRALYAIALSSLVFARTVYLVNPEFIIDSNMGIYFVIIVAATYMFVYIIKLFQEQEKNVGQKIYIGVMIVSAVLCYASSVLVMNNYVAGGNYPYIPIGMKESDVQEISEDELQNVIPAEELSEEKNRKQ